MKHRRESRFLLLSVVAAMGLPYGCARKKRPGRSPVDRTAASARGARGARGTGRPAVSRVPGDLPKACRAKARRLKGRLDGSFSILVHPPFVMAGDMNEGRLKAYTRGAVIEPAESMWTAYFRVKPNRVITVLLFSGQSSYKKWAKKLFNDTAVPYFGYYKSAIRTLVMDIHTGAGTLIHELTHALIEYDFPQVPTWFNEGLASLHEGCYVRPDRIVGITNWRLPGLQKALRAGSLRPLKALVTKRDFTGPLTGINYAQARYFVMYMQHKGLLRKFYAYFRKTFKPKTPNDVKAIEHILGEPIGQVDRAMRSWVRTLKYER